MDSNQILSTPTGTARLSDLFQDTVRGLREDIEIGSDELGESLTAPGVSLCLATGPMTLDGSQYDGRLIIGCANMVLVGVFPGQVYRAGSLRYVLRWRMRDNGRLVLGVYVLVTVKPDPIVCREPRLPVIRSVPAFMLQWNSRGGRLNTSRKRRQTDGPG